MREIKIKVCGLRDAGDIVKVSELHPDFMGFIFYAHSPRYVGDDFRIPESLPPSTKRVGVFVNESTKVILKKVKDHLLDFVQLHGEETAEQCLELKKHNIGVIKVFSVDDQTDFSSTRDYQDSVDYFLFDTKGKLYGGNARRFNWSVLARYDQKIPFFLSGGITPEHIEEINKLMNLNLMAIDVNSGVEMSPAVKDVNKIKAIRETLNIKI